MLKSGGAVLVANPRMRKALAAAVKKSAAAKSAALVIGAGATLATVVGILAVGPGQPVIATTSAAQEQSENTGVTPPESAVGAQEGAASTRAGQESPHALLAQLAVKGSAPKTGYSREQFGSAWTDDVDVQGGHNGCDTKNDVRRRDMREVEIKPGTRGCKVIGGVLYDPYTDSTAPLAKVQIDHVVALGDAWRTGAQQLSPATRTALANDPMNLLAVDGATNQAKGDKNAASWLPPNKRFRCKYVTRQIMVKSKYDLWVTEAEKEAITRVLNEC
jgi:hypothetical protein